MEKAGLLVWVTKDRRLAWPLVQASRWLHRRWFAALWGNSKFLLKDGHRSSEAGKQAGQYGWIQFYTVYNKNYTPLPKHRL
jgi:hypothetical protein